MRCSDATEWLVAFRAAPFERFRALLCGTDQIFPYFRLGGAELLFYILPTPGDATNPQAEQDLALVDQVLQKWFQSQIYQSVPGPERWNGFANHAAGAIGLLTLLRPHNTVNWLCANWGQAFVWAESLTRPNSQNLRASLATAMPNGKWMETFWNDPASAYASLIAGYSNPHPYERADPPVVACMMFGQLEANDPARAALDSAVMAWLESWRRQRPPTRPGPYQNWVRQLCDTLALAYILQLPETSRTFHQEQAMWESVCAQHVIAPCRDPLSAFRRALTQHKGR